MMKDAGYVSMPPSYAVLVERIKEGGHVYKAVKSSLMQSKDTMHWKIHIHLLRIHNYHYKMLMQIGTLASPPFIFLKSFNDTSSEYVKMVTSTEFGVWASTSILVTPN